MLWDEGGESGGEVSGGSDSSSGSESYDSSGGSESYDSSSESSAFSSSDSELDSAVDDSSESSAFSSSDSQLDSAVYDSSESSAFSSSESQLDSAVYDSSESSAFSSSDSQLDSAVDGSEGNNSAVLESTDSQLNSTIAENQSENPDENHSEKADEEQSETPEVSKEIPAEKDEAPAEKETNGVEIHPLEDTEANNEYLSPHNEQLHINSQLSEIRGDPEKAAEIISKDALRDRIERDTTMTDDKEMRSQYVDMGKAKGFLQEEMIKSTLSSDFEVSEHTVMSVHEDGTITYTDIEATARQDVEISDGVVIHAGEKLAIESKAGSEQYLTAQIDHISKQLEGMPEDSHRMLFVTADVNRMSDESKAQLGEVLEEHNATINVLPYYADDLRNTIMHMDVRVDYSSELETVEAQTPESTAEETQAHEGNEITVEIPETSEDIDTVNELPEENKALSELSDSERDAVINAAISQAMEHDPSISPEMAEEYRSRIHFANLDEVAKENNVDPEYARRIRGYYSPDEGIKINADADGAKTDEALATITNEAVRMGEQRRARNGNAE